MLLLLLFVPAVAVVVVNVVAKPLVVVVCVLVKLYFDRFLLRCRKQFAHFLSLYLSLSFTLCRSLSFAFSSLTFCTSHVLDYLLLCFCIVVAISHEFIYTTIHK